MSATRPDLTPEPGHVYYQFGVRLVVVDVQAGVVVYRCRKGPVLTASVERFVHDLENGSMVRVGGLELVT